jgi:hypothetical protein
MLSVSKYRSASSIVVTTFGILFIFGVPYICGAFCNWSSIREVGCSLQLLDVNKICRFKKKKKEMFTYHFSIQLKIL